MEKTLGLRAAPFTAFTDNGDINIPMVRIQAEIYKRNGIAGVFICGTTGEAASMDINEKKALFGEWSRYRGPGFKVIGFLGGTSSKECADLADYAVKVGLDAVAVTSPYYQRPSSIQTLADFCCEIAGRIPDMPFYYYHIPSCTGVNFPMIRLLECVDGRIQNFAGIKYTYENMMDFQLCLAYGHGKYDMLWGRDEMLLEALSIGCKGAVGSTYNYSAPLYISLMNEFYAGHLENAAYLQLQAVNFISLLKKYGNGCGKAFMKAIGCDCGHCRLPLDNLHDNDYTAFRSELEALDFFRYACK